MEWNLQSVKLCAKINYFVVYIGTIRVPDYQISPSAAGSVPSLAPVCLFGVCSVSVRDAERLGGSGSGVFIGVEVDGERDKRSGGTIEVT
jgi:hypothetical protein